MKLIRRITVMLCAVCLLCIWQPGAVRADDSVVTLDLSNGRITISPTGYSQGGSDEVAYT